MLKSALRFSHELLAEVVEQGDFVVDATMGRGNDTLKLAQLVGKTGQVLAFDIQKDALQQTKKRLQEANMTECVCLKLEGHENIGKYLKQEIKAAIFNLGFLPGSDKTVITKAETTIVAVEALIGHLCFGGRIILVVYYGHPGGITEKKALLKFVQSLPQAQFNVLQYQFINQVNSPPFVLVLEKKNANV